MAVDAREALRAVPVLAGLSDDALADLAARARRARLAPGEILVEEGTAPDAFYVIADGEVDARKRAGGEEVLVNVCGPGEVIGELALLEGVPRSATVRAVRPTEVLAFERDVLDELLAVPEVARALLATVVARLRRTEELAQRAETLAALGRIAGGLAHELNNPAAAVQRSAAALDDHLGALAGLGPAGAAVGASAGDDPAALDPLRREARERELASLLEARGVAEAWDLAPALAARGITASALAGLDAAALRWIGHVAAAGAAVAEIREGARRITALVTAVRIHTRGGRDDLALGEVDVKDGLERTLLLLGHRLRGVRVERDYDPAVGRITGLAAELEGVWMNLLGNAIDAMEERGALAIRTRAVDADTIEVAITDTGPGLAPEVRARLFEPFVTTKPPGQGTGLGLSLVRHVVVHRHGGRIEVDSAPGGTTFRVVLPRRAAGGGR